MSNETLQTAGEVIDALGGTNAVASLLNLKANRVSNWRKAGTFPPHCYVALISALALKGKSAPNSLWKMSGAPVTETAA